MVKLMQLKTDSRCIEEQTSQRAYNQEGMAEPILELRQLCRLDDLLVHSVDEALADLVGLSVRDAIYQKLERTYFIPKAKLPEHLDDLFDVLGRIFGKGNRVIGRVIAKRLYRKLEWQFVDIPQFGLSEYLDMARGRLARATGPILSA